MKKIIVVLLMIIYQPIYADDGLNIQVHLKRTYELYAEYPVFVDKDRFIFSRYDKTGNTKEVVSVDPLFGKEHILAGGRDVLYLADTESYVAYFEPGPGVPGRVKLLRKSDGRVFQSVRLSQGAMKAIFVDDQLMVLQGWSRVAPYSKPASHWSVFDVPTLKFVREFDAPAVRTIVHLERETVFLDVQHIGIYSDNFGEKYSANFPHEPYLNGYCDPESLIVTNQMAVFMANCGEIYSFSLINGELKQRLRLYQRFYTLASDGKYLFAVPKDPASLSGYSGAVVIDLSNWKIVGKFKAMGYASYLNGSNLAVMSFPKWGKGLVSVYEYKASGLDK